MRKWIKICSVTISVVFLLFLGIKGSFEHFPDQHTILLIFFSSFLLVVLITPPVKKLAIKLKILDYPAERKVHSAPMPFLGGLAVAFSLYVVILINFHFSFQMKGVILGSLLLLITGLLDDIKPLSAWVRLLAQIMACLILATHGVMISFFQHTFVGNVGAFFITFLWIMWVINAVNFFDGLDGLASGLVAIAGIFFLVVAIQTNQPYLGYLAATLIGSCIGFLLYNFHPAEIFLGDAGSSFLGFSLGALTVMGGWSERGATIAFSVPILILGVFIFDMLYIVISRIITGKTKTFKEILEYVGKDHLHHRLIGIGLTHRQSVLFIYLLAICMGLGAIVLRTTISPLNVTFLIFQAFIIFVILGFLMSLAKK